MIYAFIISNMTKQKVPRAWYQQPCRVVTVAPLHHCIALYTRVTFRLTKFIFVTLSSFIPDAVI